MIQSLRCRKSSPLAKAPLPKAPPTTAPPSALQQCAAIAIVLQAFPTFWADVLQVIPMLAGDATEQTPPDLPSYLFKERIVYLVRPALPDLPSYLFKERIVYLVCPALPDLPSYLFKGRIVYLVRLPASGVTPDYAFVL